MSDFVPIAVLRGHTGAVNCCSFFSASLLLSGYNLLLTIKRSLRALSISDIVGELNIWSLESRRPTISKLVHAASIVSVSTICHYSGNILT